MKSFPMFIRTSGRTVIVVGGGEQAAQKTRLMLKTDARIVVAAPLLEEELASLAAEGRIHQHTGPIEASTFKGAAMAFIASGCPGIDASLHAIAKAAGCAVNVVDQPHLCDLTTPSIVDRDPVVVAIGTEGTAPVLARQIKTQIEESLPITLGGFAALAGRLRDSVARSIPRPDRRAFWRWVFADAPRQSWTRGAEREAATMIKDAIRTGSVPTAKASGSIALVGAGPGARDLLTIRAVQRLQEADVIFYDRLVDPDVLELARRDAERVFVGKIVGAHAWPQERINQIIVAEALKGRQVVRLKSGDPGIFGRATEELTAAREAGIPVEIVPGITAACAAAASAGMSLTERGKTDTLVLSTGMRQAGEPLPDCARFARPGASLVFYMSVGQASRITDALVRKGLPPSAPVRISANVSKATEQHIQTTLIDLSGVIDRHGIKGCAVILVTWPMEKAHILPSPRSAVA